MSGLWRALRRRLIPRHPQAAHEAAAPPRESASAPQAQAGPQSEAKYAARRIELSKTEEGHLLRVSDGRYSAVRVLSDLEAACALANGLLRPEWTRNHYRC